VQARGRGRWWLWLVMGAGLAGAGPPGCAHDEGLVPAPQASVVPGAPRLAYDQEGAVAIWVDGDGWRGDPRDLEQVMTPILVTVSNRGQRPLRLMYRDFALEFPTGIRVNPLPPFSMHTAGPVRTTLVEVPAFRHRGFFVAPYYGAYYPGLRRWHRPLPHDPFFYDTYYARWLVSLPTTDMLRGALPEGVLEPGGSVTGFLYFPDVPREARGLFVFRATLPDDPDGRNVASLDVPLVPRK
jgi:hypothetical protein